MSILSALRLRDILVNGKIADEVPAEELIETLDRDIEAALELKVDQERVDGELSESRQHMDHRFEIVSAELELLREEMRRLFAEQEARHQQQLNRLAATMLGGAALIAAVVGVLVVVFG